MTWDATAELVKIRLTENPLYYYKLTGQNPTTGKISLPVAIMISSDQCKPTMKHWMKCFRNDEKWIYGANNSDRAMVFVTTAMKVFNLSILKDSARWCKLGRIINDDSSHLCVSLDEEFERDC